MFKKGDLVFYMDWGPYRVTKVIDLWGKREYALTGVYWAALYSFAAEKDMRVYVEGQDVPRLGKGVSYDPL